MKKVMLLGLMVVFVFCNFGIPSISQDGEAGANIIIGLIEDELLAESAKEVSEILRDLSNAAQQAGVEKSVGPFIRSIKRNTDALLKASQHLPQDRCKHIITEEKIQKIISTVNKLQGRLCSNVNARKYRQGKCAKFLNDPVKFQQCEAAEHGGGRGMSGGSSICLLIQCDEKGKPIMASPPSEPKQDCLSDEQFATALNTLQGLYQRESADFIADNNNNGIPDICENNKKPAEKEM